MIKGEQGWGSYPAMVIVDLARARRMVRGEGFYGAQSGTRSDLLVSPGEGRNVSDSSKVEAYPGRLVREALKKVKAARCAGWALVERVLKTASQNRRFFASLNLVVKRC